MDTVATNKGFCIRAWSISARIGEANLMCAEVYYKTEDEAQDKLFEIRQCMAGHDPSTVRIGDAVVRGEIIGCVRLFQAGKS